MLRTTEINLSELLLNYGCNASDLRFEGKGEYGECYSFESNNKIYALKFSNKLSEYNCAVKLYEKQQKSYENTIFEHSAKIYEIGSFTEPVNNFSFYILMEYIIIDENLSYLFYEYLEYKNNYELSDFIEDNPEAEQFRWLELIQESIEASDLHSENLGYGENGLIKGFDWDINN